LDAVVDAEIDDAVGLATSELLSNAVRHSGCGPSEEIRLLIDVTTTVVRVEVEQPTSTRGAEIVDPLERGADGGYGLSIVESLSARWDITSGLPGRVWFEMACT
jgi:anti-sigma regulatory factor (Ser/Thr protein kinase)